MNILDLINKYTLVAFSHESYFGYRIRIMVQNKFVVSIVAGNGAYSSPRENISIISEYDKWEAAYFYTNNTPMYLDYNESGIISNVSEHTEIDPDAYVTIEEIQETITRILEVLK